MNYFYDINTFLQITKKKCFFKIYLELGYDSESQNLNLHLLNRSPLHFEIK